MQDRKTLGLWLGIGLFAALLFAAWYFRRPSYHWSDVYNSSSKEPYALSLLYNLLKEDPSFSGFTPLKDSLNGRFHQLTLTKKQTSYFFTGHEPYYTPDDVDVLLDFVERGNTAFLAAERLPDSLIMALFGPSNCDEDGLYEENAFAYFSDSTVRVNFLHPNLKRGGHYTFHYVYNFKREEREWYYLDTTLFCRELPYPIEAIAKDKRGRAYFFRIAYGEGHFYFHTFPRLLTNYYLSTQLGKHYVERCLGHLPASELYWDEYSNSFAAIQRQQKWDWQSNPQASRRLSEESPLQFILRNPPLRAAWYTLLGMGLLYMVFQARRRQRAIPVLAKSTNDTLAFLKTVGYIAWRKGRHHDLAVQAIKLFKGHIWERYRLNWEPESPNFARQLALRSAYPEHKLAPLLKAAEEIPRYQTGLPEANLIKFYQQLEDFYQQTK